MDIRPQAEALCRAKSIAQEVADRWPSDADGSGKLDQAIGLLGECESELDAAADEHGEAA